VIHVDGGGRTVDCGYSEDMTTDDKGEEFIEESRNALVNVDLVRPQQRGS